MLSETKKKKGYNKRCSRSIARETSPISKYEIGMWACTILVKRKEARKNMGVREALHRPLQL